MTCVALVLPCLGILVACPLLVISSHYTDSTWRDLWRVLRLPLPILPRARARLPK